MYARPNKDSQGRHFLASISLDLSDRVPHNPPVNLALKGGGAL
jgi:hypothetical protein